MLEASRQRILRSLAESDLVLDVGGGGRPFERADWVLDLMAYDDRGLYAYEADETRERFTRDTWVRGDACDRTRWPFSDKQFDFAVCSHTLEDLRDPLWVCSELMRVGKAGYIEVPSRLEEQSWGVEGPWVGRSHHRWLIDIEEDRIDFFMKHHEIHRPGGNHFPAGFCDNLSEEQRVLTFFWQGSFSCRERVFFSFGEVETYLSEFVSRNQRNSGDGWVRRRLRPSGARDKSTAIALPRVGSVTQDLFRVLTRGDRTARDELRFRLERRLGGPIGSEYTRFFVDRFIRSDTFLADRQQRPKWLGVPTWKIPLDAWTIQEIIVETRPDLIIETGTQFGGAALFYASLLDLFGNGRVVTIDVDHSSVHKSTRAHPRVTLIQGMSSSGKVIERVSRLAGGQRVMVILDSDHRFENVSRELQMLGPLVSPGCYLIVENTALGRLYLPDWGDPAGALAAWLAKHPEFEVDVARDRFAVTTNPRGYVRRRGGVGSTDAPGTAPKPNRSERGER